MEDTNASIPNQNHNVNNIENRMEDRDVVNQNCNNDDINPNGIINEQKMDIDDIKIVRNGLVVYVNISKYDGDAKNPLKCKDFPKFISKLNDVNVKKTFIEHLGYDMIRLKNGNCSKDDLKMIIKIAKTKFEDKKYGYDCLIFIFSGHGNEKGIICSDLINNKKTNSPSNWMIGMIMELFGMNKNVENIDEAHKKYKYQIKDFDEVTNSFNGYRVPEQVKTPKLFFLDTCRGTKNPKPVKPVGNDMDQDKGVPIAKCWDGYGNDLDGEECDDGHGNAGYHADGNTAVFFPNTKGNNTYSSEKGGLLITSLCNAFKKKDKISLSQVIKDLRKQIDNKVICFPDKDKQNTITCTFMLDTPQFTIESDNIFFTKNTKDKKNRPLLTEDFFFWRSFNVIFE